MFVYHNFCPQPTFLDDRDPRECVRHGDPGRDEGQAHHGVRDGEGEADHGDHPDHHVGVDRDPDDRHHEGGHEEAGELLLSAVWNWKRKTLVTFTDLLILNM